MLYLNHSYNERKKDKNMHFFNPTSELKELLLLQHIKDKPDTTHKEMAKVISGAPSMVNVYIENLEEKGLLLRNYKSSKIVFYNITQDGIKRKNFLSINYLYELLKLYRLAEKNIEKYLLKIEAQGYKNLLFYGAGEVADTILRITKGRTNKLLKVLAIIDDDKHRQQKELLGYKIISREDIEKYKHDAIVITSYTYEEKILKGLKEINYPVDKIKKFFSEE